MKHLRSILPPPQFPPLLWPHQYVGVRRALAKTGFLFHWHMGRGKTRGAICLSERLRASRVLVLTRRNCLHVFFEDLEKYTARPVSVITKRPTWSSEKTAQVIRKGLEHVSAREPLWIVVNHETAWRGAVRKVLYSCEWDMLIIDESHRIKSPGSNVSKFTGTLARRCKFRLLMTGTPDPNGAIDYYAQFRTMQPKVLGPTLAAFKLRWCVMGGPRGNQILYYRDTQQFATTIAPYVHHVGKDVEGLPPEIDQKVYCRFRPRLKRLFDDMKEHAVAFLRTELGGGKTLEQLCTANNILAQLTRLRQLGSGIFQAEGEESAQRLGTEKLGLLRDILEDLGTEPVVIFCHFRPEIDMINALLEERGIRQLELSGRRDDREEWQSGGGRVLVVQAQAGAEGISLVRACYAVHFSLSYDATIYWQTRARVHRPGQTRPTTHIHLINEDSLDPIILRALQRKKKASQEILRFLLQP